MNGKRILILTSTGGQGLLSSSEALAESLMAAMGRGGEVKVVDFFAHGSRMGRSLSALYNVLLRHSLRLDALFMRLLYAVRPDRWTGVHRRALRYVEALVEGYRPDAIIITSQFLVTAISEYMASRHPSIPVCVANIDPGRRCAPVWFHRLARLHVLPTEETLRGYQAHGFPRERAVVAGFTVRQRYLEASLVERNAVRRGLGVPEDVFLAVVAGSREGYNGIIPLLRTIRPLPGLMIVAACGTNAPLLGRVTALGREPGAPLRALGWRDDLEKFFRAADVVIAKPGKQTTVETLTVETPLISICYPAVMVQETGNVELLRSHGVGFPACDAGMVVELLRSFKEHRERLDEARLRLRRLRRLVVDPGAVAGAILEMIGDFRSVDPGSEGAASGVSARTGVPR